MPVTSFEIHIRRLPDASLAVDATLTSARSVAPAQLARGVPLDLDMPALLALSTDPHAYGAALSAQLFADERLRRAWAQARAYASAISILQVRLRLDATAHALHAIRWETLHDPESGQPLALDEWVRLVRTLDSADLRPVQLPLRPELRALVIVSNPSDLGAYNLAELDADGEVARARAALGDIPTTILGDHADAAGRATLAQITAQLRAAAPIVLLIAHGTLRDAQPLLWLEQDDGSADPVAGPAFVDAVARLAARPLLLALLSCQSAGRGYGDALRALGPGLARVGLPAVLGFQGDVAMSTVKALLPPLIGELRRDGQIDRALAAARAALGAKKPWWQAVLWLRTDGQLWREEETPPAAGSVISIDRAQTGDVTIGAVAGGNITTINVWLWDGLGQEVPTWLIKQLDQQEQRRDAKERLAEADLERLKQEVQRRWRQVNWASAAQHYRVKIQELYGSMHIFGMSQPVPLTNIFTDVYLLDKPSALRRHTIEQLKERPLLHADPLSAEDRREGVALVAKHKRLFILGQPGAGKTTFLKHLAIQAMQNQIAAIPIFVSLKDWSDKQIDLMDFLVRQFAICSFPDARSFIETILEAGRVLVLFDGLDEVSAAGGQQQRITRAIREFAQQYGQSQAVITCRTAATEFNFEGFTYCEVADFSQTEIEAFVGRWFAQNDVKRKAFLTAFAQAENERLRDLARRPLLLTMLCLTFDETMSFPQRRAELYEEAIDALLKKWDNSRSIERDQPYRSLSLGYKQQLLAELAAETFDTSAFFIAKAELSQRIVRFMQRIPQTGQSDDIDGEVILRAIEAQHGLLIERARGIYSFSHLTFHEYFAARYIVENPDPQILSATVAQATNKQWREVLLLTSSMLGYRTSATFFQLWSQQLQAQLREHSALVKMMQWVSQQAAGAELGMRAAIQTITLIDQAIVHSKQIITMIENDRAHTFEFACAFDRIIIRARAIACVIDIDFDITIDRARARARVLTLTLKPTLACARTLDPDLDCAIASNRITTGFIVQITDQQRATLKTIPERDWQLNEAQLRTFGNYLASTELLLDCLDLAAIADRQAVLDQLLMPPK